MALTQRKVDGLLKAPGPDAVHWDDHGLGFRVQGGRCSWVVRYRVKAASGPGKQRQQTIAPGTLRLDKARAHAAEITRQGRQGIDPIDERRERETARKAREAEDQARSARRLGRIIELYLADVRAPARHSTARPLRPATVREVERHLSKHWLPLHELVADELDRRTIVGRLEELKAESGPVSANRARAYLSMALGWATERGLVAINPVAGIKPLTREETRDRVLSDEELRAVWAATAGAGDFGRIVRLLLLTGQRRDEVGAMTWAEVDTVKALWTLPSARTKNGRVHEVPLSALALALLGEPGQGIVFGRGRGFGGWSQGKARLDEAITLIRRDAADPAWCGKPRNDADRGAYALPSWTLHDLRRTCATGMAGIGIGPHIVEAVLNHVSGHRAGVAGIYNRATYAAEKRDALYRWSEHVLRLSDDFAASPLEH